MTNTATYEDAIQVAANLIEPENYDSPVHGGNAEYIRGQVELICDLFGYKRYSEEPRETVEADLRRAVMGGPFIVGISGEPPRILRRFATEAEASEFIETLEDHADGRYYIDDMTKVEA